MGVVARRVGACLAVLLLGMLSPGIASAASDDGDSGQACRRGDRGRLLGEEAPFADTLVSVERLRKRGADVSVRRLPGFDHVNSWVQAMPRAARYFTTATAHATSAR